MNRPIISIYISFKIIQPWELGNVQIERNWNDIRKRRNEWIDLRKSIGITFGLETSTTTSDLDI